MKLLLRKRKSKRHRRSLPLQLVRKRACILSALTDVEFRSAAANLRNESASTNTLDRVEAFAYATEAVRRTTGKTYYDVQLLAGSVLGDGHLAEMATGEGKTLVTLLPVYHSVLNGTNVHVATTNSYLAQRDSQELSAAFDMLNVSLGLLPEENDDSAKRAAYACDVTFGTGYEFGFDYLRDQLRLRQQQTDLAGDEWLRSLQETPRPTPRLIQSPRDVTIVDEIDSVLIDEANTPLVISFFASKTIDDEPYRRAANVADSLQDGQDYCVDSQSSVISITQSGLKEISRRQHADNKLDLRRPWRIYIEQALRARHLLRRDVDYVVRDGAVALVDQQTGRIFPERKWRDGLHQAIEFREAVALTPETDSFARISRQRFFTLYGSATGMTGTASDAEDEFQRFFSLDVVPIPLNRPSQRIALPTRSFADASAKFTAIAADVADKHQLGQPVLIGTRTIEQSRIVADMLCERGLPHTVLNGLQDADEAEIVSAAGRSGAITVATNMAGRGTDIKLDEQARQCGGLHVVVAEPNRSHRVDRQLVGRAARQGDPGSCQIFVASDDELLTSVGGSLGERIRRKADGTGEANIPIEAQLHSAQRAAEQTDFARRQHLMQQELWVDGVLQNLVGTG